MAYLITKLTLDETIKMAETLERSAFQHVIDAEKQNIKNQTELEARQKYRDYQYSLTSYLKELKRKT